MNPADETTVVVFDCFGTIVTERRPMPGADDFTRAVAETLGIGSGLAGEVVETVFTTLYAALVDKSALQPATRDLVGTALRDRGVARPAQDVDRALWRALGCCDDDRYELCEPAAEAMRRVAAAGHTVRLLSNCYLPGDLMRRLLTGLKVPEVYDLALFTADGGPKKPDARAFELITTGPFRRKVMVGDSAGNDIAPARRLGWDTVQVDPGRPDFAGLDALLGLR
ncbi:HAD family hydrolase [Actinomadura graeca]|uniref:HAD family hydrolase n=1 Tax=Actinomadura graeca TaxID=2750812 RepID=A0ABX8R9M9_9ACTN|nr:HAD family hydrolase [Actinomadura graeca]QXJ25688.1 HAD family hydrolase [Actinomadura graeca]